MSCERGQATIEWVGVVTLLTLAFAALAAVVPVVDGRSFGGFLASRMVCAVRGGGCGDGPALRRAYGDRDAELVRRNAPGLVYEPGEREVPVDFRSCRAVACARAPDDRDLDVHRSDGRRPVTTFTRVVHHGGRTYIQYWLYYPDSNSTVLASDTIWRAAHLGKGPAYPGFHRDDWEGYEVRIGRHGRVDSRATSHGGLQWCKWAECHGRFGPSTGWTRVSRGSHSGHVPLERHATRRYGGNTGRAGPGAGAGQSTRTRYRVQLPGVNLRERSSTPEGLRLVPLETLDTSHYRPLDRRVSPPWRKALYRDPEGAGS